nr:hypothetical protein [Tanacetum cinerariifolium]
QTCLILTILDKITDCSGLKLLDIIMKDRIIIPSSGGWTLIITMIGSACNTNILTLLLEYRTFDLLSMIDKHSRGILSKKLPPAVLKTFPGFVEGFVGFLKKIGDFVMQICCFEREKELIDEFRDEIFLGLCDHKEKMLLCKQAEQGDSLQAEQYDWMANTDEEVDDTCIVETNDSNVTRDSPDMCNNDIQNDQNDVDNDDEHVALANLIANLKLDVDENKKI